MKVVGKITKIEAQKNNQNRCSIFIDGKFLAGIDAELVYKCNLEKGKEISEELIEELLGEEEFLKAKNAAFKLLSYRQRSKQELKDRLRKKGFEGFIIEQVLRVLESLDYLDDREFSKLWIKDRINKKYGPWRIRKQLQEKGVAKEIIKEELDKEYDFELQYKLATQVTKKKKGRYSGLDYRERRYKLSQVLKRKGFSFEVINLVLDDLLRKDEKDESIGSNGYSY